MNERFTPPEAKAQMEGEKNYEEIDGFEKGIEVNVESIKSVLEEKDSALMVLAGKSGSGKSTYANRFREMLTQEGIDSTIVGSDDFYKHSGDELDIEKHLDLEKLHDTIIRLQNGEAVGKYEPAQLIIVEGLQVVDNDVLGQKPDHKTYLKAPFGNRIPGRLIRDAEKGYRTVKESLTLLVNMATENIEKFNEYEKDPDISDVDMVVNNDYVSEEAPQIYIVGDQLSFAVKGEVEESIQVTAEQAQALEKIGITTK